MSVKTFNPLSLDKELDTFFKDIHILLEGAALVKRNIGMNGT